MADGDHLTDDDRVEVTHAVEDSAVLHVGASTDADGVDVASDDGVHPDAGVFAQDDIADDLGGGVDVAAGGNDWGNSLVRPDHSSAL